MEIIVDDREQIILPFLEDASSEYKIDYKVERLETGDYAIFFNGKLIIIIERKSWADLEASIRDGRKNNVEKLKIARDKTGCLIAYLVEGKFKKSRFSHIPLSSLQSHLDHLILRDNIHIIYSESKELTADRIFEFARNFSTIKEFKKGAGIKADSSNVKAGGADKDGKIDVFDDKANDLDIKTDIAVVKTPIKNLSCKRDHILRFIPGVGTIIAGLLSENNISFKTIINDEKNNSIITDKDNIKINGLKQTNIIANIRYPTGAAIGISKATKIVSNAKKIINKDLSSYDKHRIKLLESIPLISKKTAIKLLETYNITDFIINDENSDCNTNKAELIEKLSKFEKTTKAKLGKKAAINIVEFLND
jgi:ERCC4-type nuclease